MATEANKFIALGNDSGHCDFGFKTEARGTDGIDKGVFVVGNEIGVHGIGVSSFGVFGESEGGPGVAGKADQTEGVRGESKSYYGGYFKSGSRAQIHLEPLEAEPPLSPGNQAI